MKYNNLKNNAQNIHMPEDMKERIIKTAKMPLKLTTLNSQTMFLRSRNTITAIS